MRRYLVALVVGVGLVWPACAAGEIWPPTEWTPQGVRPFDARANYALGIAEHFWGPEPDCPNIVGQLTSQLQPEGEEIKGTNRGSGWNGAEWTPCQIVVVEAADFVQECLYVVHEYGHLMGLSHSLDLHNIMAPSVADGYTYMPGCYWPRRQRRLRRSESAVGRGN